MQTNIMFVFYIMHTCIHVYIYIHVYIDIQHTHPISSLKEKEQASESERERKKEICIKELVHMIVEAGKLKICRVDRTSKVCV